MSQFHGADSLDTRPAGFVLQPSHSLDTRPDGKSISRPCRQALFSWIRDVSMHDRLNAELFRLVTILDQADEKSAIWHVAGRLWTQKSRIMILDPDDTRLRQRLSIMCDACDLRSTDPWARINELVHCDQCDVEICADCAMPQSGLMVCPMCVTEPLENRSITANREGSEMCGVESRGRW